MSKSLQQQAVTFQERKSSCESVVPASMGMAVMMGEDIQRTFSRSRSLRRTGCRVPRRISPSSPWVPQVQSETLTCCRRRIVGTRVFFGKRGLQERGTRTLGNFANQEDVFVEQRMSLDVIDFSALRPSARLSSFVTAGPAS